MEKTETIIDLINQITNNDYKFLLDMFNKRELSDRQEKRCTAIILSSIKPFIKDKLKNKFKSNS